MVFCNFEKQMGDAVFNTVTILILIDGFLQYDEVVYGKPFVRVTILILIDGFLQYI